MPPRKKIKFPRKSSTLKTASKKVLRSVDSDVQIHVSKMYKDGNVVTKDTHDAEVVTLRIPSEKVPMGEVGCEGRVTINLGNYESVQVGVSVRLPCMPVELEDAFIVAKSFLDTHLNREVDAIKEFRDDRS